MITITLAEKKAIVEKYPDVHIVRTMKQKSGRHRYYMVEEAGPMKLLRAMRGIETKGGAGHTKQNSWRKPV